MVEFELATKEDAKTLADISKQAFHYDINYGATGEGGPYGYDSPEFQEKIIEANITSYYKILSEDTIIGGFWVRTNLKGRYILDRIFIKPEFQNQGIGTKAFEFIFNEFSEAKVWLLDTPIWNQRTRHFYEKLGFEITKIIDDGVHYRRKGSLWIVRYM